MAQIVAQASDAQRGALCIGDAQLWLQPRDVVNHLACQVRHADAVFEAVVARACATRTTLWTRRCSGGVREK